MTLNRRDLTCLEALYDAPEGTSALAALEAAGLDFPNAQQWLAEARVAGLVGEIEPSFVPQDRPTGRGAQLVQEAIQRRLNRSHIRRTAQRRVLAWADNTGGGNIRAFLVSDDAWVDGHTLTLEEVAEAAKALHDDGLVKARIMGSWQADVVRAEVTILPSGKDVVDEFGGDPVAWRAAQARDRASVNIEHNNGAIAIGSHGANVSASVTNGVDPDKLAALVEALTAARGTLSLTGADEDEYETNLAELESGEPGRVTRALRWFGQLGRDISTNALGGILAGQALTLLGG